MSQLMHPDRVWRGNCVTGSSWSPSPSFPHSLSEDWGGGKLKEEGETGKLNQKRTHIYAPHCSTIHTMLLLLNVNILLGRDLCSFSSKSKRGHQFFSFQ